MASVEQNGEERDQRRVDRIEIVMAILLGVAAVLAAWATFQSAQLSGSVAGLYSQGIRAADAASQDYNDATAVAVADEAIFLEYTKALHTGQAKLAAYVHGSLMSPELAAAVDWWEAQPDSYESATPFTSPQHDKAKVREAQAEARFDEADRIDALATSFDILSIIIAIALFLFGVASLVRQERIKIGLGIVGTVVLIFSIIRLLSLGNPAGVGFGTLW